MYQKWKSQKINDIFTIDRPLPSSNKIKKLFRIFPPIFIHNRSKIMSTSPPSPKTVHRSIKNTFSKSDSLTLFLITARTITFVKMKGDSPKTNPTNHTQIETTFTSFSNIHFFIIQNVRSAFSKNAFVDIIFDAFVSMFFSAKSAPKNRKKHRINRCSYLMNSVFHFLQIHF